MGLYVYAPDHDVLYNKFSGFLPSRDMAFFPFSRILPYDDGVTDNLLPRGSPHWLAHITAMCQELSHHKHTIRQLVRAPHGIFS